MNPFAGINLMSDVYGILICLILLMYLFFGENRRGRLNRLFMLMCLSGVVIQLGDMTNWACEGFSRPWNPFLLKWGTLAFYLGCVAILLAYTRYVTEYLAAKVRVHPGFWLTARGLAGVYICFCLLSVKAGLFFTVTPENYYQRGSWFWLSQLIPFLIYGIDTAIVLRYRKALKTREVLFFMLYVILPVIGELIQIHAYGISMLTPSMTLALLIIFVNIQMERELLLKRREKELTESKLDMMLAQIQPHFLYNCLVTMRQLCEIDADEAKAAITDFSYFLRGNMNALTCRGLIPFEQELTHVRHYLSLEKRRFGDRLQVVYEIGCTDFELPPLCVQPLAENAVRHGILKKDEGGTVTIISEEREDCFQVTIRDNGVGVTEQAGERDGRAHIGLQNVQSRLSSMCMGHVSVCGKPGEGTAAVITIPKEEI